MFENPIADVTARTGLSALQADGLVRAIVARLLHNPQGGFAGLLTTIRQDDADIVAKWLGTDAKAGVVTPAEAERYLGAEFILSTAGSLDISPELVREGTARALPGIVDELTPNGMIPSADDLERSYGGWAGGRVAVRRIDTANPPISDFPGEPSTAQVVQMDLARPSVPIVARAFDKAGTLLPWAALFLALPILQVATCGIRPPGAAGHGEAAHGGAAHSELAPTGGAAHSNNAEAERNGGRGEATAETH